MGYPTYPPPMAEPAEMQSIKSLLHVVRILAIVFGVLLALAGLAYAALVAAAYGTCTSIAGGYCGASLGALLIGPIVILIFGIVDVVIYLQMKAIEGLVNQRRFDEAKAKTFLWMILGFILGGIIVGILLLVAYLKFDPLINWQRSSGSAPPPGNPIPPSMAQPGAASTPPAPASAAATTPCPRCGRPATWVAQYNRWYCSSEQQYL